MEQVLFRPNALCAAEPRGRETIKRIRTRKHCNLVKDAERENRKRSVADVVQRDECFVIQGLTKIYTRI